MLYERIEDLPAEVQVLQPEQAKLWMLTYNRVFSQTEDPMASALAAWGAIDKSKFRAVKMLGGGKQVLGWAMMFTDELNLDLHSTFFSHLTSMYLDYYPTAPLWYEHGFDPDYGSKPIGRRNPDTIKVYAHGVLMGHDLHLTHPKYARTEDETARGLLSYSSDSIGHYVDQGFNFLNGEIREWPFAGCSLTRQPAEPALGKVALKSFVDQVETLYQNRPVKVFPTLRLRSRESAGGAKGSQAAGTENRDRERQRPVFSKGTGEMDPQMLADLASFFGVDATVDAVRAALEQTIAALESGSGDSQMSDALPVGRSAMCSALELAENATDQEMADGLRDILNLLNEDEADEPDQAPLAVAAKAARERREDRNRLPTYHNPARRNAPNVNFNNAPKPGLLDLIGAASQISGGQAQFPMPAFRSGVSPRQALRTMQIINGPNGGYLLNREMSDELLEELYSVLIFTQLGVQVIPMSGMESITFNRLVTGAQAYWAGAGQTVTAANPTVKGAVTLQLREIVSESIQQNRLLRNSSSALERMIQDDMVAAMARKMEYSSLYGSGGVPDDGSSTGAEPLGLSNITGITKTSLSSKAPKIDDFVDVEGRIEDTDLEYGFAPGWISHNRLRRALKKMKNAEGDPIYSESWMALEVGGRKKRVREMDLNGMPMVTSTQVPTTTTSGVITTDVFFGEWTHMLLGQGQDMEVVVDTSVLVRQRQTLIQIVSEYDSGVAYKEAVQILNDVKVN